MKKSLNITVATILVAGLTVASGVLQGGLTNRWGAPPAMLDAAEQLKGVPIQVGDWQMQSEEEMGETTINMLELAGYVNRVYVNETTGQTVHVAVLLGPAGRISVHTPEICYSSRDYKQKDQRQRTPIPTKKSADEPEDLWRLTFESRDVSRHIVCVYYGWTRGEQWSATEGPRWEYAGSPYLYKIQLSTQLPPGVPLEETDTCKDFLVDFLPVLKQYLVVQ